MIVERHGFAPTAPMPSDLETCRWCAGEKRAFLPGMPLDICNAGCDPNDLASVVGHCSECRRQYLTGKKGAAVMCHGCEQKELAVVTAGHQDSGEYYAFKKVGRGGYRQS